MSETRSGHTLLVDDEDEELRVWGFFDDDYEGDPDAALVLDQGGDRVIVGRGDVAPLLRSLLALVRGRGVEP